MKRDLYVKPLPEWEVKGKKYTAAEPYLLHAPKEIDGQFTTPVGRFTKIPGTQRQALEIGARFKRQSMNDDQPTLQRYELEFRDEVDSATEMEELFSDVRVIGPDGQALPPRAPRAELEKAVLEAVARVKALEGELESTHELAQSSGHEAARLDLQVGKLSASIRELQSVAEKAADENKRLEAENAELRAKVEAAEKLAHGRKK